jgi:hypothetical protein
MGYTPQQEGSSTSGALVGTKMVQALILTQTAGQDQGLFLLRAFIQRIHQHFLLYHQPIPLDKFNILVQLYIQLINISLNHSSSDNNQLILNHLSRHSHQCTTPLSITSW